MVDEHKDSSDPDIIPVAEFSGRLKGIRKHLQRGQKVEDELMSIRPELIELNNLLFEQKSELLYATSPVHQLATSLLHQKPFYNFGCTICCTLYSDLESFKQHGRDVLHKEKSIDMVKLFICTLCQDKPFRSPYTAASHAYQCHRNLPIDQCVVKHHLLQILPASTRDTLCKIEHLGNQVFGPDSY